MLCSITAKVADIGWDTHTRSVVDREDTGSRKVK